MELTWEASFHVLLVGSDAIIAEVDGLAIGGEVDGRGAKVPVEHCLVMRLFEGEHHC